jgi:hypothetical protein
MSKMKLFFAVSAFLLFTISGLIFPQSMHKEPYLIYNGNETEMQVIWQLYSTDTCRIEWGTDTLYALGNEPTYEYGTSHQHTYTITNLIPSTEYYYRVTVSQEAYTGTFISAPDSSADSVSFFVYGDTRSNPGIHNQVAAEMIAAYNDDPDFHSIIISVGDLVSNGDSESIWDSEFFSPTYSNIRKMLADLPYQSCIGNHEGTGVLFKKYFPYPFVSGRYWSFDYGPAHFVVVDQYTSYGPGSAQLTWIENDLASTDKPWKFIYLHEPGWSAGGHSNNTNVQNYIQPLCLEYGVPIVFAGHNHYYARAVVNNVQHITTGGGGAPLYQPDPGFPYIVTTAMKNHFCKVTIAGDTLRFEAVTPSGEVIDSFTIENPAVGIIPQKDQELPRRFILNEAYPNPFNPATTISWQTPAPGRQTLKVYDILGREVATLVDEFRPAGKYEMKWSAENEPGGVYFCRLQSGNMVQTKKIVLLK